MTMQTWEQIRQWRKEQRDALIERRMAVAPHDRKLWSERITDGIRQILAVEASDSARLLLAVPRRVPMRARSPKHCALKECGSRYRSFCA